MQILKDIEVHTLTMGRYFPTRFGGDSRQLQSSVQTYGILHPPRLFHDGNRFLILDGFERIKIAREMGVKELPCYVYDKKHLSKQNAFLLCIELNRLGRPFNLVEKAQLLKVAYQIFSNANIPKAFWTLIEIPHNIHSIQQFKNLLKLPVAVQKYAINNNTSLATILTFLKFKAEEVEKLAAQLFTLPLNQNKLSEILNLLLDISKREDKSPQAILDDMLPALELEFSPNQKEQKLRQLLQQRRNPRYEKQLANFEVLVKNLPINDKTRVQPAPFFEDDYVEVTTKLRSQEDIKKFISALQDASWMNLLKNKD